MKWLVSIFVVLALMVGAANAAILDQSQTEFDVGAIASSGGANELETAQTYTVGMSGYLKYIDIPLFRFGYTGPESFIFDIRTTTGGMPDNDNASALGSITMAAASITADDTSIRERVNWTRFDFSAMDIWLDAGSLLAMTMRSDLLADDESFYGLWGNNQEAVYAGGDSYYRLLNSEIPEERDWTLMSSTPYPFQDKAFETFMGLEPGAAIPTPEPSTFFLLGAGLLGLIGINRKRLSGN